MALEQPAAWLTMSAFGSYAAQNGDEVTRHGPSSAPFAAMSPASVSSLAGADGLKIFPCSVLGTDGLRATRAVLPLGTQVYAVGGAAPENFASALPCGFPRIVKRAQRPSRPCRSPRTYAAKPPEFASGEVPVPILSVVSSGTLCALESCLAPHYAMDELSGRNNTDSG
jgi:hypothetical protein